jgi:hypothetical protein
MNCSRQPAYMDALMTNRDNAITRPLSSAVAQEESNVH